MPKVLALRLAATDVDTDVLCRTLSRRLSAAVRTVSADHPLVLLRQARAMRKNVANCDVVHTFGTRPLACAIAAGATRIVHSLTRFPTSADTRWLRAAVQHRAIEIVCPTDTLRRALVTRGVPISRTHLVRPGVSLGDFQTQRDEKIRAALGFSPGDRVLFAPGDIRHNGISASMWAASLLAVIDERYKILVHARGENADAINRLSSRLIDGRIVINAARVPIEKVFGAADVVLITPSDDAGVRPILITMAMAAQRPIVASTVASVCELIEDRHTAMLIRDANPRSIAGRVMACFDDPQAAWKLADRARAEVYDHFTITKMLAKLEGVYATFRTSVQASGLTKTL